MVTLLWLGVAGIRRLSQAPVPAGRSAGLASVGASRGPCSPPCCSPTAAARCAPTPLVDALWGDAAPASAVKTVHKHVCDLGDRQCVASTLSNLAAVALRAGDPARAGALLAERMAVCREATGTEPQLTSPR
jgi:hypothetical protein